MKLQAIFLAAAIGLAPSMASADAMFSAEAESSFTISAGTATMVEGDPFTIIEAGTGMLGAPAIAVSGIGESPITVDIGLTGSATPIGIADGFILGGHLIEIDNSLGTAPIIATFSFEYSFDLSASVVDPILESAFASAFFHITGIDNETLTVDGLGVVPDWLLNPTVEAGFPMDLVFSSFLGFDTITGSISVPGGEIGAFSVITDVAGTAISAPEIPEPASLALLGFGLAGLAIGRRRS